MKLCFETPKVERKEICIYIVFCFVFLWGTPKSQNPRNILYQCFIENLFYELSHISFTNIYEMNWFYNLYFMRLWSFTTKMFMIIFTDNYFYFPYGGEIPHDHDCVLIDISVNEWFDSLKIEMSWSVDGGFDMCICSCILTSLNRLSSLFITNIILNISL